MGSIFKIGCSISFFYPSEKNLQTEIVVLMSSYVGLHKNVSLRNGLESCMVVLLVSVTVM